VTVVGSGGEPGEAGTGAGAGEGGSDTGCGTGEGSPLLELRADGYDQSDAQALNADGSYAVGRVWKGTGLGRTGAVGVRWKYATATLLETSPDWDRVGPTSISSDGSVVAGVVATASRSFAFTSDGTSVHELPGLVAGGFSMAAAISGDATIVAGYALDETSTSVPVRWSGDHLTALPTPNGIDALSPVAVSDDGTVISGTGATTNNEDQGVKWTNSTAMPLDIDVQVTGMSDDGKVIVGLETTTTTTSTTYRAVRYDANGRGYLPPPETGWNCAAMATNGDGSIVLGQCDSAPERVFLWSQEHGSVTLDSLALELGVDLTPYTRRTPKDISGDGTTVLLSASRDGAMVALRLRIRCAFP
jgi:uncharacterized membrane protein